VRFAGGITRENADISSEFKDFLNKILAVRLKFVVRNNGN